MAVERVHGKDGKVSKYVGEAETNIPIKGWEGTKSVDPASATTNEDGGFTNVVAGNKSFNGTVTCLWDKLQEENAVPMELSEGDEVTLYLKPSGGGAVSGGYWSVPALITEITVRAQDGDAVGWTFAFQNRGEYEWIERVDA
jgi:hypothetical protein